MNDGNVFDATMNFESKLTPTVPGRCAVGCMGSCMAELQRPGEAGNLFGRVSALIEETPAIDAAQVDAALTLMNWRIGHLIDSEVLGKQRAGSAEEPVAILSPQLMKRYRG